MEVSDFRLDHFLQPHASLLPWKFLYRQVRKFFFRTIIFSLIHYKFQSIIFTNTVFNDCLAFLRLQKSVIVNPVKYGEISIQSVVH